MTLARAEDVSKTYMSGEVEVQPLKELSFEIEPASFVSFVGPSGGRDDYYSIFLSPCLNPTEGSFARSNLRFSKSATASPRVPPPHK